jgi:hypothetical protein
MQLQAQRRTQAPPSATSSARYGARPRLSSGFRTKPSSGQKCGPWSRGAATLVCLLLLALLTFVQVAHVHPSANDADHCPVCVVMHSAAPVELVTPVPIVVVSLAPVPIPALRSAVRRWHYTLFNRPPPAQG